MATKSGLFANKQDRTGFLHLLVVYIVWGSTYLAIRVAVREGSGFTPFMLGTMRLLLAGVILLALGKLSGNSLRLSKKDLITLAGSGFFLWTLGNGFVMLGETHTDSALAALVVATTPIWIAVIQALIDRKAPSILLIGSLLVGSAGIVLLSWPVLRTGVHADWISLLEIVLASMAWAVGSVWQSRNRPMMAPAVSSGYQTLFGGIGFLAITLFLGEPIPHPTAQAWLAWGYLVVFGSILAFTSYVQVLRLLPIRIVSTYSYVNPIIAVLLGWLILREQITLWTLGGAALVLVGVAGVFRAHANDLSKH